MLFDGDNAFLHLSVFSKNAATSESLSLLKQLLVLNTGFGSAQEKQKLTKISGLPLVYYPHDGLVRKYKESPEAKMKTNK